LYLDSLKVTAITYCHCQAVSTHCKIDVMIGERFMYQYFITFAVIAEVMHKDFAVANLSLYVVQLLLIL